MCLAVINKPSKKIITFKENKGSIERIIKNNIHISNKPIFVYKKFNISYDLDINSELITKFYLKTPFQNFPVNMDGELMTCKEFTGSFKKTFWNPNPHSSFPTLSLSFYLGIHKGIHAYTNQRYGLSNLRLHNILVKCMIPEYTPVIYGNNSDIVSLQLIVPPITKKELPPQMQNRLDKNLII